MRKRVAWSLTCRQEDMWSAGLCDNEIVERGEEEEEEDEIVARVSKRQFQQQRHGRVAWILKSWKVTEKSKGSFSQRSSESRYLLLETATAISD